MFCLIRGVDLQAIALKASMITMVVALVALRASLAS
jgi:hypothetical protein